MCDICLAIEKELNRHSIIDIEFPLVMRVKGLVDRYAALAECHENLSAQVTRANEALAEVDRWNPLRNDLDAYLLKVTNWGMGKDKERPNPETFGIHWTDS